MSGSAGETDAECMEVSVEAGSAVEKRVRPVAGVRKHPLAGEKDGRTEQLPFRASLWTA
ncbi:MAG: hypothetical protein ACLR6B_00015 [Blautia sp.]